MDWFSRRIIGAVIFAIVFGTACFFLGRWQLSRYEAKDARAAAIEANYGRDPVPLAQVLPDARATLPEERAWSRVTATGRYAAERQLYVRARALGGVQGYEILVPLLVDGGATLLVNRGWVANAAQADQLPPVPSAPTTPVTVVGWLKPGEESRSSGLPVGQLGSVDLEQAWGQLEGQLPGPAGRASYAAYLVLGEERVTGGQSPPRPTPLEPPTPDRGPHFAYALQWWLTSALGIAFVGYLYRSRPGAAEARAARTAAPPRAKKVRIWDEEDE